MYLGDESTESLLADLKTETDPAVYAALRAELEERRANGADIPALPEEAPDV